MDRTERLGVAALAAAAGALAGVAGAAGMAATRRPEGLQRALPLGRAPLELLPVNEPHPQHLTAEAGDGAADAAVADGPDASDPSGAPDAGSGPRRRARTAQVAGAISYMAVGALLTLLVLWSLGTWAGASTGVEVLVSPPEGAEGTAGADVVADAAADGPAGAGPPAAGPAGDAAGDGGSTDGGAPRDGVPVVQRPAPTRVEIPAIGVSARVIPLGRQADGALEVPEDFGLAGWWTGGPEPGEIGPAVIVGHVDSFSGPAIFFDLDQLAYDDRIVVTRGDGSRATFAVRTAMRVDKAAFPTDLVYGPTDDAQLRLVTCDGDFADGSYLGNLIVTADLVSESAPPAAGPTY
jgi:sortase (surface protein transpeptidase)